MRQHRKRESEDTPLPYRIQVLDRTFGVLDALMDSDREMGIGDLTSRLKLSKSTVHRLLMVLDHNRYIDRSQTTGKYRLGAKLFELGMKVLASLNLRDAVQPRLVHLVAKTGETAHFGILYDRQVTSLFHVQTTRSLGTPSTVGRRIPVFCTSLGKAILAFLPQSGAETLIPGLPFKAYTRNTIIRPSLLAAELERIRKRGYAVDNEEFEIGLRCIGAPVRNYSGEVAGALSIAGPAVRVTKRRTAELARFVVQAAEEVSENLGGSNILPGPK